MNHVPGRTILGIDMGTSSIKVCVMDEETGEIISSNSRDTTARPNSCPEAAWSLQETHRILSALHLLVSGLGREKLALVRHIIVCGQMHGLVLWRGWGQGWCRSQYGRFETKICSKLVTWQDRRCDKEFLETLPEPEGGPSISTGHGCATLFWYSRNDATCLQEYNCAGTIVDYVVAMLADLDQPVMSVQMAASWGYFNSKTRQWNLDRLTAANFPVQFLPRVVEPGTVVGRLTQPWESIPSNATIYVGLGDLQCSVYNCLSKRGAAALNLSTSAQLAFRLPSSSSLNGSLPATVDMVPFFLREEYLAVAASLNGGNVLARFVKMLQSWTYELGLTSVQDAQLWARLTELATQATDTDLHVMPTIFGERHCPAQRAEVSYIRTQNLQLGSVYKALCKGVIRNLSDMMSHELLKQAGITKLIGSGSALTRNTVLQETVIAEFSDLEVEFVTGKGACVGAATYIRDLLQNDQPRN